MYDGDVSEDFVVSDVAALTTPPAVSAKRTHESTLQFVVAEHARASSAYATHDPSSPTAAQEVEDTTRAASSAASTPTLVSPPTNASVSRPRDAAANDHERDAEMAKTESPTKSATQNPPVVITRRDDRLFSPPGPTTATKAAVSSARDGSGSICRPPHPVARPGLKVRRVDGWRLRLFSRTGGNHLFAARAEHPASQMWSAGSAPSPLHFAGRDAYLIAPRWFASRGARRRSRCWCRTTR